MTSSERPCAKSLTSVAPVSSLVLIASKGAVVGPGPDQTLISPCSVPVQQAARKA